MIDFNRLSQEAGFGGHQRNTLRVKLEVFARKIAAECANVAESCEPDDRGQLTVQDIADTIRTEGRV